MGSSYGVQGLENRVFKNHLDEKYREREPNKPLYQAMSEPDTTTQFMLLAEYESKVETAQVLLTEATFVSVFGTLRLKAFQSLRLPDLPPADWSCGLNRSSPVAEEIGTQVGEDMTTFRRMRTLENAELAGPTYVTVRRNEAGEATNYTFNLFQMMFVIPIKAARDWKLDIEPEINVLWDVANERHPHAYAPRSADHDDGRRVGIKVFKEVDGETQELWLVRKLNHERGIKVANTVFDLMSGRVVGKRYK